MKNSPQNAKCISLSNKKEISHVFTRMVQNEIRAGIDYIFFCLLDNEAHDGIYKKTNYSSC
jgi:hypothetical protein